MTPTEWLIAWFRNRDQRAMPDTDFFAAGLLDSLDVVELVTAVESHYDIRLTPQQFRDRRFSTVRGLAEIIGEATGA